MRRNAMKIQYMSDLHLKFWKTLSKNYRQVWIFGHSHSNINAQLGDTKLLCNQMGYVAYGEHCGGFDEGRFVEL